MQFALTKGTTRHRITGWLWVALMVVVSVTAFFIHELRVWGPWSPIHLLAIFTLVDAAAGGAACAAPSRPQSQARHDRIFVGALIIAGLFTFLPGRIMHAIVFGP